MLNNVLRNLTFCFFIRFQLFHQHLAVNSNNIKILLANGKSNNIAFFITGKVIFINSPKILPRYLSNSSVFDNFTLAYEL